MSAVEVHHLVEGPEEAPALVLINSLGSNLAMWEPQIETPGNEEFAVTTSGNASPLTSRIIKSTASGLPAKRNAGWKMPTPAPR